MRKIIFTLCVMSLLLQSCQSQSGFDLTQINLNKDKITDIAGPNSKEYADDHLLEGKKVLVSKNSKLLCFNNIPFEGQQNPDNNDSGINGVSFYYNTNDDVLYMYNIHIYSLNEAEKIIKTAHEKLGEPNYTYFGRDKKSKKKYSLLWEDKENKILYCLRVKLDSTTKASFYVLYNFDDIKKIEFPGGTFSSWEEYLYERKKKNDLSYTYQEYLMDLKVKDPDAFALKVTK